MYGHITMLQPSLSSPFIFGLARLNLRILPSSPYSINSKRKKEMMYAQRGWDKKNTRSSSKNFFDSIFPFKKKKKNKKKKIKRKTTAKKKLM
jgi:hypothetical protein